MPPRLKRSGTHDKASNHAAGLAPPGRRIVKQKSNGALNAANSTSHSPNGRPKSSVTPIIHPDAGVSNNNIQPSTLSPASDVPVNDTTPDANMGSSQSSPHGRDRTASGSSEDDLEAHGSSNGSVNHTANGSPLKIDVKKCNHSQQQQKSAFDSATTILKACPLWDVIAILIILLQLPPTIVSIVQFLFAYLTFGGSTTSGTSLANLPSINEMLLGHNGAPSLQTVAFLDILMLLPFIFSPQSAQNLVLDLTQVVIAISLGGAASSKGGTSLSIFSCLVIVGLSHVMRWDFVRQLGVNFVWTGLVRSGLQADTAPPTLPHTISRLAASHGFARKVVGVHILAQGLTRLVRRWYLTNELSSNKRNDPDGLISASSTPRTTTSFGDPSTETASSASTDGRPPGPSPAAREKDAVSSNKRKKKQASHVKSQQPFWAALANAKVTCLKGSEHQQASLDAQEANAADLSNVGDANFRGGKDRVWIKEVGSNDISFGVSLPSRTQQDKGVDEKVSEVSVKRFRIRLNKTDWSSTRISEETLGYDNGAERLDVWSGKIYGLTASTNYICEFVRVDDGASMFMTHVTTQPAPFTEQTSAASVQPPQTLRPLSPTTTLRSSIEAAELQLDSHRNRLKRSKRDHKSIISNLQKEVDSLHARLSSNSGNDDRQRQKVRQLEQSIQQAKVKEAETIQQIDDMTDIPVEELQASTDVRAKWQQEKDRKAAAQRAFDASKAEADRELAQLKSEMNALLQKRQKFEQRKSKFNEQREKLLSDANQSQEAQSRRYQELELQARSRNDTDRRYVEQTRNLDAQAQYMWATGGQLEAQARQLEELYNRNLQQHSMPTTPEGPLPGTRPVLHGIQHQTTFPNLQPGFQFSNTSAALPEAAILPNPMRHSDPISQLYHEGRGRSSSMLSGVSGFTDDLEGFDPVPQHHAHYYLTKGAIGHESRKSSNGSGGSTTTGSDGSSTRDPTSPSPKAMSPIGKVNLVTPLSPPPTAMR